MPPYAQGDIVYNMSDQIQQQWRFYHADNCTRQFPEGIEFQTYDTLGGTCRGVFSTDDPAIQAVADKLVATPRSAVVSIDATEYVKKATSGTKERMQTFNPIFHTSNSRPCAKFEIPVSAPVDAPILKVPQSGSDREKSEVNNVVGESLGCVGDALVVGSIPKDSNV